MEIKRIYEETKYKFKPVKIEMIFESEEELAEYFTIFNYTPITDSLKYLDGDAIRETLPSSNYNSVFKRFEESLIKHPAFKNKF